MPSDNQSISRITFLTAGLVAFGVALLFPVGHLTVRYNYAIGQLDSEAEINARIVTGMVNANPEMWKFEQIRLEGLLLRRPQDGTPESRVIHDLEGKVVAEGTSPLKPPLISRSHDIFDSGTPAARITVTRSLRPILLETSVLGLVALLFGFVAFYLLRVLPMRAVKRAQNSLEESERRYRSLYETMKEGVMLHELVTGEGGEPVDTLVLDANTSCGAIFGLPRERLIGQRGLELLGVRFIEKLPQSTELESLGFSRSFELQPDTLGRVLELTLTIPEPGKLATVIEDITERKRAEAEIERMAYYDGLTGLPNRTLAIERLTRYISRAKRERAKVAILFLDLDHFKVINDTMGHKTGDEFLVSVAGRLSKCLRPSDTLARIGGDEFIVIAAYPGDETIASTLSRRILDSLASPFALGSHEVYKSASIGIAMYPNDGENAETLLKNADMAMYSAKEGGRSGFRYFSRELDERACERLELEGCLRTATDNGELFLEYQPQVCCRLGEIVGAEALVRWRHPQRGIISPLKFIPLAEDTGLIHPVGEWVLRTACLQGAAWQKAGNPAIRIAVNLSSRQFENNDLPRLVRDILEESGLNPELLELELTESILMKNASTAVKLLGELKNLGVQLAIDDFGTGYSSLSYLKYFPIDRIKIDRAFVKEAPVNPDDAAIVEAIVAMAGSLKLDLVAEGVETPEQLSFIRSRSRAVVQGYYFSRPVHPDTFAGLFGNLPEIPPA